MLSSNKLASYGSTTSSISLTLFPCQHSTLVYSTLVMKYNNTLLSRGMLPVMETSHNECNLNFSRSGCKKSTRLAKNNISRCRVLDPRLLVRTKFSRKTSWGKSMPLGLTCEKVCLLALTRRGR